MTARCERQLLKDHYLYKKNKIGDSGNIYWEFVDRRSGNGCGQHIHPSSELKSALFQQILQWETEAFLVKIQKLETVCRGV